MATSPKAKFRLSCKLFDSLLYLYFFTDVHDFEQWRLWRWCLRIRQATEEIKYFPGVKRLRGDLAKMQGNNVLLYVNVSGGVCGARYDAQMMPENK